MTTVIWFCGSNLIFNSYELQVILGMQLFKTVFKLS